jgi:predicted nucleic acid-binding protein
VIYLDTSALLAELFGEGRAPAQRVWDSPLVSSTLLEYEVWNRIHARGFAERLSAATVALFDRIRLIEMAPRILARALRPFPVPVRTLDSLHLATIDFLVGRGEPIELASYDNRLLAAASALGIPVAEL